MTTAIPGLWVRTVRAAEAPRALLRESARRALHGLLAEAGAAEARVTETPRGPRIEAHGRALACSLAYADGFALVALAEGARVGADVTPVTLPDGWFAVASLYLGDGVAARLEALPDDRRAEAFARAWVRYEAALKRDGLTLREWSPEVAAACGAEAAECWPLCGAGRVGVVSVISAP